MPPKPSRHQLRLILPLVLLNAIALAPLLTTGYCGDDVLNSQIRGQMIRTHLGLWGLTKQSVGTWIINEGRFFPLAYYNFAVFYVIRDIFVFKLFVLTIVLTSLAAFYWFLQKLTGSVLVPCICLLLLPLTTQFRAIWDPILGFCGQYPVLTLLLFCSLVLFLKHIDHHDSRALVAATVLYLCCGLIFETAYPMCVFYLVVAYSRLRRHREAFFASLPFVAVSALLALVSLVFKRLAVATSHAYIPNFNPSQVLKGYAVQSFGAIPFSYYWLDPHRIFSSQITLWPAPIIEGLTLLVVLALITALWIRRGISSEAAHGQEARTVDLVRLGSLLFALPQVLISLSPKYQAMPWGTAYLPVYISRLGLTLLLSILLLFIYRRTRGIWGKWPGLSWAAFAVWLIFFAFNLQHNWLVAKAENELFWYPRVLTEKAVYQGLLAGAKPGSILLVNGTNLWDTANEYCGISGRLYSVYQLNSAADLTSTFQAAGGSCQVNAGQQGCEFGSTAAVYTVQIRHLTDGTGAVLLAHVSRSYQANNRINGLLADQVTAYFRLPATIPDLRGSISGKIVHPIGADASLFRIGEDRADVLRRGRGWELLSFEPGYTFDALSLHGDISPEVSKSAIPVVKEESAWLHSAGRSLLHIGDENGPRGEGIQQPAMSFSNEMSIEVIASPERYQVPWADILSNHGPDYRGIAIEQQGDRTNQFSISMGNGASWMRAGAFTLTPGRHSYISLQVKGKQTTLYLNGQLVSRILHPLPPASTGRSLYVGNWVNGDRPFNGSVDEVLISTGNKSEGQIAADAARILGKDPPRKCPSWRQVGAKNSCQP